MDKLVTLSGASTLYKSARDEIKKVNTALTAIDENKVGYAVVEDGYLILKANEDSEDVIAKVSGIGGGGGGGGSATTNLIFKTVGENKWVNKSVPEGYSAVQQFVWSSELDGESTGPGTLEIKIDNEVVKKVDINPGNFEEDFSNYVTKGAEHAIQVSITDAYDNSRRLRFTLTFLEYKIFSEFDPSNAQEGPFTYRFTPVGVGEKTFHFLMDGTEFDTIVSESEREMNYVVLTENPNYPEGFQWHGAHKFEVYFTVMIGTVSLPSNTLSYELICVDPDLPDAPPIITSDFTTTKASQYSNIVIPYYVYTPGTKTSEVELYINGELQISLDNVPRAQQTWSYRFTEVKTYEMKIKSKSTEKIFNIVVSGIDVNVRPVEGPDLDLSAEGKSNADTMGRATWEYYSTFFGETIRAEFRNFTWNTDGWINNESTDYVTTLRVKDNAKVIIPYAPFHKDLKQLRFKDGQTFEFEFKTTNVFDYDTELIKCYNGDRKLGFRINAQEVHLTGSINSIYSQYKKDEVVRVTFVITPLGANSFIYCYINGILSKVAAFTDSESFTQDPPSYIEIGSPNAIIDLYRIRIYNKALSRFDVVNNWIADMHNSEDIIKYYNENSIYANNQFDISFEAVKAKLTTLPYIVVDIDSTTSTDGKVQVHSLPTRKGNKVLCDGYYVDPVNEYNSFSWKRGELDVQGTSSQAYPIKNFKLKIKKAKTYGTESQKATDCSGFIMTKATQEYGEEIIFSKYSMRGYSDYTKWAKDSDKSKGYKGPLSIPTNTFVFKADFASSEGTNNVELVRFYNELAESQDILTPPQDPNMGGDKRVRIGIDGFPIDYLCTR